jgi:hypothetical protein
MRDPYLTLGIARTNHGVGHGQGINKAAAHCLNVKRGGASNASSFIV